MLGELDGDTGRGARGRACSERALGDAVLEGVVGEHGDAATHGQHVDRVHDRALPGAQLVVDLDAQRLEVRLAGCPPVRCDAAGTA